MDSEVELLIDLRGMREEAKVSVERVSELAGIGRSTIARIEMGDMPSLGNALRLARFLKMSVEEIWRLSE